MTIIVIFMALDTKLYSFTFDSMTPTGSYQVLMHNVCVY